MIHGDRNKIDLSLSTFEDFILEDKLYVDKTKFIENILHESSSVLLLTRPRRTGKSLNMDMLRSFLDCNQNTSPLFKGLWIKQSPCFHLHLNQYPVIYLDFKNIRASNYATQLKMMIGEIAQYYLSELPRELDYSLDIATPLDTNLLLYLCKAIYKQVGRRPYVLIDEYDKILMDNLDSPQYEEIRLFLTELFEIGLKGNAALEKAVLTGVARISKESLLSGLNNLVVYDIFTPSVFDTDFSLTESETMALVHNPDDYETVKRWYNNIRVGNHQLFHIFSVMSFLHFGTLSNYWGKSGTIELLIKLLNKKRTETLATLIEDLNEFVITKLEPRLSVRDLLKNDTGLYYYSLAVQSGYLTYDIANKEGSEIQYKVFIPNLELQSVWRDFIMNNIVRDASVQLKDIFKQIENIDYFAKSLQSFMDYQLSYFDLEDELEKTYHVFVFGMVLALGYHCRSNMESGLGRYDLMVEGDSFVAIMEFKKAEKQSDLKKKTEEALAQIQNQQYAEGLKTSLPVYKIGIGCYKKKSFVLVKR